MVRNGISFIWHGIGCAPLIGAQRLRSCLLYTSSWESADDGMAAIFHLDENAKWHDGEPVTAQDWVFTAQLITDPDFGFGLKSEFNSWAGTDEAGVEESENSVQVEALDVYKRQFMDRPPMPASCLRWKMPLPF